MFTTSMKKHLPEQFKHVYGWPQMIHVQSSTSMATLCIIHHKYLLLFLDYIALPKNLTNVVVVK